jgi:outer membrane protein TolC
MARKLMATLACALFALGAAAEPKPKAKPRVNAVNAVLARHLEMAIEIDAQSRTLEAQRGAIGARYHTSSSITPGSPYVAGSFRRNSGGNLHGAREREFEAGMPLWLPGQREAYENTVTAGLVEVEERLALRRLEVAALLRDAWWNAQRAARDVAIARNRLSTARDIGRDMSRRVELGESGQQDALLARNETLAAETELAQAEAAVKATRIAYAALTGGASPDGVLEPLAPSRPIDEHPALRAPLASIARAETQARLVDATFIDNPEIGVFARHEKSTEYELGRDPSELFRTDSSTVGFRFKIPLPTPGRNEPRKAEAEAELVKAHAEFDRARRLLETEIISARAALSAARRAEGLAAKRLAVANEQFELARKAFQLGEVSAVDLYRVRQSQLDAQRAQASAAIDVGVAQSRLNQALGYAPEF